MSTGPMNWRKKQPVKKLHKFGRRVIEWLLAMFLTIRT